MRPRRSLLVALVALVASSALAQGARDLVFGWASGDFRAPLVCTFEGSPRQALRRIRIYPVPRSSPPELRVQLYDLDAPRGTTCSGAHGEDEPNLIGAIDLVYEGRSRPDTGTVDFRNALRREGGFELRVRGGRLRVGPAGEPSEGLPVIDVSEGVGRVREVPSGSDAARRLAAFGASRQLLLDLDLALPETRTLRFELVELPR